MRTAAWSSIFELERVDDLVGGLDLLRQIDVLALERLEGLAEALLHPCAHGQHVVVEPRELVDEMYARLHVVSSIPVAPSQPKRPEM